MTELTIIQNIQHAWSGWEREATVIFFARYLVFVFVLLAALTSWKKRSRLLRHSAYEAAWAGLLAFTFAMLIGVLIGRARPFLASADVALIIPAPASPYSFPSAHTSVTFAAAFAFAFGNMWIGGIAFLMAAGVAFGRVATGVHYPSDVLGGVAVGWISFLAVRFIHRAIRKRDVRAAGHGQSPLV